MSKTGDQQLLAEYLIDSITSRATGSNDDFCVNTFPKDKYFIGNLRPRPSESEEFDEDFDIFNEFQNKLSPIAMGAEFNLNPDHIPTKIDTILQFNVYYRVFPSFTEQSNHQMANQQTMSTDFSNDRNTQDTMFIKFKKISFCLKSPIKIDKDKKNGFIINLDEITKAINIELDRCKSLILQDPNRLKINDSVTNNIRVSQDHLQSEESYNAFLSTFTQELNYNWQIEFTAEIQPTNVKDSIIFLIEIVNTSAFTSEVESKLTDIFLFDINLVISTDNNTFVPFSLDLSAKSFRYNNQLVARGINCDVVKTETTEINETYKLTTIPIYKQSVYETKTTPEAKFDDLFTNPIPILDNILAAMKEYEANWDKQLQEYIKNDITWEDKHKQEFLLDKQKYMREVTLFELGLNLIKTDKDIELAFKLTNKTFSKNPTKKSWRLFQIVFIVSQIPSIYTLKTPTADYEKLREVVDIIYFPTGGGKTEAYLGVIVFHIFFDRLRGKSAGVTAWTRFPLRLLTIQQMQRVADIICLAELIRQEQTDKRLSGKDIDGFAVGYFVGAEATPNKIVSPMGTDLPTEAWSIANDPALRQKWKKIIKCPNCGTTSISVIFDSTTFRLLHKCSNEKCRYKDGILPIYIVDNDIYRYLPSVIVGTIDKLASIGNQRKMSLLMGRVTHKCQIHGYANTICSQDGCKDPKLLSNSLPIGISAPTLFIQDELHLLKEGLGTFDGHYETYLQTIIQEFGFKSPIKIIASSATIEAFERQVKHIYGRKANMFPGYGPILGESFYARTVDLPRRIYVGILPHNKTIFRSMLELIQYYHELIFELNNNVFTTNPFSGSVKPGSDEWKNLIDLFSTSLLYFSSSKELNATRTDLESAINPELERKGQTPLIIEELTGSTNTDKVTNILERLEKPSFITKSPINTILATNMISHGVDVDRFNAMFFYGMPRQNAEYIQASSRVGRSNVGIVFCVLKPTRERDHSHFLYFKKYHEYLGQLVEPVAINRWSKFSISRTLPGLFVATLLQNMTNLDRNPNKLYFTETIKNLISRGLLTTEMFTSLLEKAYLYNETDLNLISKVKDKIQESIRSYFDQIAAPSHSNVFISDALVPKPMTSLRDVDEQIKIELDSDGSNWADKLGGN